MTVVFDCVSTPAIVVAKDIEVQCDLTSAIFLAKDCRECISECHNVGLSDEQGIRTLVLFLRDWNWQEEDLSRVNGSLNSFLNIPKQLVLAFQAAPEIEHDFHMLLRYTILTPKDVCTVLLVYIPLNISPIQQSPFTEASLDGDDEWSSDYDQSKALTPGKLAYLIMHHLRELHIDDNEVQSETLVIFNELLRNNSNSLDCGCPPPQSNTFQEYIAVFVCIMKGSRSLNEIKQWLGLSSHHVVVCKEVIQEVCSWTSTEERGHEESLRMVKKILEVFKKLIAPLCNARSNAEYLYLLTKILRNIQDEEIIYSLFELLFISTRCTATCVDVIAEWNKCESFAFLTKLTGKYEGCSPVDIGKIDNEWAVWVQILPFVSKAFPNCAKKVGDFFEKMIDNHELDDALSLGRIPIWFKQMTDAGFPQPIIESWCTSLVLSEKLSSSDVDAITKPDSRHNPTHHKRIRWWKENLGLLMVTIKSQDMLHKLIDIVNLITLITTTATTPSRTITHHYISNTTTTYYRTSPPPPYDITTNYHQHHHQQHHRHYTPSAPLPPPHTIITAPPPYISTPPPPPSTPPPQHTAYHHTAPPPSASTTATTTIHCTTTTITTTISITPPPPSATTTTPPPPPLPISTTAISTTAKKAHERRGKSEGKSNPRQEKEEKKSQEVNCTKENRQASAQ
ncbi:hypothetical protein QZH41_004325 [Actinostola sp. cb2023]|nr:hypothetical protein QZH41_004325 [Actinostola sp. cb2023]